MGERSLILADEPTGALDSETGEQVLALLRARCDAGAAALLVTHEARHAGWADRVVFLRDGAVVDEAALVGHPGRVPVRQRVRPVSRMIGHWRPVLRMARRDLRRHKVRALLTCLLVALPMVVATVAALASYNSATRRDVEATEQMRQADGVAVVSSWSRLDRREALWLNTSDTGGPAQRRDPASVELAALLPPGSSVTPCPVQRDIALPSGGTSLRRVRRPGDPLFAGGSELTAGRAPARAGRGRDLRRRPPTSSGC